MALGDNLAFLNETTFGLADEQTSITGISGTDITAVGRGAIDAPTAKVLFDLQGGGPGEGGPFNALVNDVERNLSFKVEYLQRYADQTVSIITADRLAIQATLPEGASGQIIALSAKGFNSVGPTLRRLYHLGYV